jgi:hypothetical protein
MLKVRHIPLRLAMEADVSSALRRKWHNEQIVFCRVIGRCIPLEAPGQEALNLKSRARIIGITADSVYRGKP